MFIVVLVLVLVLEELPHGPPWLTAEDAEDRRVYINHSLDSSDSWFPMDRPGSPQRTQRAAEKGYCFRYTGKTNSTFCIGELVPHGPPKPRAETQRRSGVLIRPIGPVSLIGPIEAACFLTPEIHLFFPASPCLRVAVPVHYPRSEIAATLFLWRCIRVLVHRWPGTATLQLLNAG